MNIVKSEDIETTIDNMVFHVYRVPDTTTTVAVGFLPNGFQLGIATSACVDKHNYDFEKGKNVAIDIARKQAKDRLWELRGYELYQELNNE